MITVNDHAPKHFPKQKSMVIAGHYYYLKYLII